MAPSKLGRTRGTLMLQCSTPRRKIPRPIPSPTPAAGPEAAPPLRRNRTPMGLDHVPTGSNVPEEINVVIEIPKDAEPVKYEVDKDSGAIFVDRILSTPMRYPCNYGYLPRPICAPGAPADALAHLPRPLPPAPATR